MATNAELHGQSYVFGFGSGFAPTIANFTARGAEFKIDNEIWAVATDGEGMTEALALNIASARKVSLTLTGYISTGFTAIQLPTNFNLTYGGVNRFFLIKDISEPHKKGEYVEISLSCESFALITT